MKVAVPAPRGAELIRPMPGIRMWRNPGNGFVVCEVHYTADPKRRGDWKYRASPKYGGLKSWRWRKEQEIDWTARSGKLIFVNFEEGIHVPSFPFEPPAHWPRWILVDPGWTNPTSMLWAAVDMDAKPNQWGYRPVHIYREFYRRRHGAHAIAFYAHDMSSPTDRNGNRELEEIEELIVDPGALQEHQSAGGGKTDKVDDNAETVFQQLQDEVMELGWDVPVSTGNNHKNEAILEIIARLANYWISADGVPLYDENDDFRPATDEEILQGAYLAEPTLFIHPTCPNTVQELKKYVWGEWASAEVQERRNEQEKPVDKDDHSITNIIRFVNELRKLRGDVGEEAEQGLIDLSEFASRFTRRTVRSVEEVAADYHESRAARYRKGAKRKRAG